MKDVFVRPLQHGDSELIERWRRSYFKGFLEYPHGLQQAGVETVVGMKNNKPICSLTGIQSIVMDPFARDTDAAPTDLLYALVKMETTLAYLGQKTGAVDVYIAVPNSEQRYVRLLQNYGFRPTVENCVVLRRALVPDHVPLLANDPAFLAALSEHDRKSLEYNKTEGL